VKGELLPEACLQITQPFSRWEFVFAAIPAQLKNCGADSFAAPGGQRRDPLASEDQYGAKRRVHVFQVGS
jgi:hypothetical protein